MFGRKKTKQDVVLWHPAFGEMKYVADSWKATTGVKLDLWNRTYEVECYLLSEAATNGVTEAQEAAIEKFGNVVVEQKSSIEEIIMKFSESDNEEKIGNRFIPDHIYFSQKGECALFVLDNYEDDYDSKFDAGFAILLVPKLLLCPAEDCLAYLLRGEGYFTDEELYGGGSL
jgi:hypothetical protein